MDATVNADLKDILAFLQPYAWVVVGCVVVISVGYAVHLMRKK